MSVPEHTIQGTDAWRVYRSARGGASELAALLGISPWFPRTPRELWMVKTGRAEVHENEAMRRGTRLEHAAREYLEEVIGDVFEPQVKEDGRIVASLDGLSFDGRMVLEIKIPAAGEESELFRHVMAVGAPPDHYLFQIQQQLMVSGAERCRFAVCVAQCDDIVDAFMVDILPDESVHTDIRQRWEQFFYYLDNDIEPPLTDRDVIERSDPEWSDAAEAYRIAKRALGNAQSAEKVARERLQELAGERSAKGCGVAATRYFVQGAVDYKQAIPADVDLERFRKPGRYQWRITEAKE